MTLTNHVLVTGAAGLIGSYTIRLLHDYGAKVAGLYKKVPQDPLPWPVLSGDLAGVSMDAIAGDATQYRAIVHCAAYLPATDAELAKAFRINRSIDENVIEYVSGYAVKLIYLSGTSVYGCSGDTFTEDAAPHPQGDYVTGKYDSENEIKSLIKNYVILRVSAPYGPCQKSRTVLRIFIENAFAQKPLLYYGSGEREQDFTYAGDVAKAILKCIEKPEVNGIFNIASGKPLNMKMLARIVVDNVNDSKSDIQASGIPDKQEDCKARFSIEKARNQLGWEPETSPEAGIRKWISQIADENRCS